MTEVKIETYISSMWCDDWGIIYSAGVPLADDTARHRKCIVMSRISCIVYQLTPIIGKSLLSCQKKNDESPLVLPIGSLSEFQSGSTAQWVMPNLPDFKYVFQDKAYLCQQSRIDSSSYGLDSVSGHCTNIVTQCI